MAVAIVGTKFTMSITNFTVHICLFAKFNSCLSKKKVAASHCGPSWPLAWGVVSLSSPPPLPADWWYVCSLEYRHYDIRQLRAEEEPCSGPIVILINQAARHLVQEGDVPRCTIYRQWRIQLTAVGGLKPFLPLLLLLPSLSLPLAPLASATA
jgi:hypothetical protein